MGSVNNMKPEELLNKRILVHSRLSSLSELFVFEFSGSKKYAKVGLESGNMRWVNYEVDYKKDIVFDDGYYTFVEILPEISKKVVKVEPELSKVEEKK